MKRSILFLLFLLLTPIFALGQNEKSLGGTVTDEHGHTLAYVNIGIVGTSVGTVSGMDGSFRLYLPASVKPQDTLRFSMVGHEGRSYTVSDFESDFGVNAVVALPQVATLLAEVVVKPRFTKKKHIGMDKPGTRMAVNFAISDKPNQNLGAEIGRKFNLPKGPVQLDTFRFYVSRNNFDTVRLRLNLYLLEKGRPGGQLLDKNIVLELKPKQQGWVVVDLAAHNLVVSGDVVVAVEWIYHAGQGTSLSLPIAMPSGGVHFYKFGSQGQWKKFPGMSSAMELDVQY